MVGINYEQRVKIEKNGPDPKLLTSGFFMALFPTTYFL